MIITSTILLTNAVITAYCACTICCGPQATGLNSAGRPPKQGLSIAASRSVPLGSKVVYRGQTFIVDDRMAKRLDLASGKGKPKRFDLFFNSHQDAKSFGIRTNQNVRIEVLFKH